MPSEQSEKTSVTIQELLESGAHFGHQKRRWNPKMRRFILEERNGIYIINLAKTLQQIRDASQVVVDVIAKHKSILFVGTKKQAKAVIKQVAEEAGEFYVAERWLGGMLTNLSTIRKSVKKLEKIEKLISSGTEALKKKELALLQKEQIKLDRNLAGIRSMRKTPGLVIVVDPNKEHIAVAEAKKLGIPVMALVDTNCDPDPIDHVIACNDDALKSIKIVLSSLMRAIVAKKSEMQVPLKKEKSEEENPKDWNEKEEQKDTKDD
ncbi:MAG: 30S ribosomal protein S2 [Chlamydiota bacterium]